MAFEILRRVEHAGAFASILLEKKESQLADPRDAALTHELVLGVLRRQSALDHVLGHAASRSPERMDPEVRIALRLGAYGLLFLQRVPNFAAVDTAVELVKNSCSAAAAGFANGVLRRISREGASLLPSEPRAGDCAALALYHSHPQWWVEKLVDGQGWETATRVLERNNEPATPVLRPNLRRIQPAELGERLAREGLVTEPCEFLQQALRVRSGNPTRCSALDEGLAWIQDEAAQLVPLLFGPEAADCVADLCAAPGGKTMQLAERVSPGGTLLAADRHFGRLDRLRQLARRVRPPGLLVVQADLAGPAPLKAEFDRILVDAPCSGTGTLRRHPEIRWRLRENDLKLLAGRQRRLLETAAKLLAPGGDLVYSVCSVEAEEGEAVVRGLLASQPDLTVEDPRPGMPETCRELFGGDRFLRTSPATGDHDGFFAALLRRHSGR